MSAPSYPQRPFSVPADATEIVLVRHGASQAYVAGEPFELIEGGHADPPLAPEGERQAALVGARLAAGPPPRAVVVTPLQRTQQTAAPFLAATGLSATVVPELREVHLGAWEGGELRVRVAHGDPVARRVLAEERWSIIPGAEEADAFAARVRAGLEATIALARGGRGDPDPDPDADADADPEADADPDPDPEARITVVAVLHGGVIGELCRQATGSRPFAFIHADNGSISRLVSHADGRLLLRSFNDTSHLP